MSAEAIQQWVPHVALLVGLGAPDLRRSYLAMVEVTVRLGRGQAYSIAVAPVVKRLCRAPDLRLQVRIDLIYPQSYHNVVVLGDGLEYLPVGHRLDMDVSVSRGLEFIITWKDKTRQKVKGAALDMLEQEGRTCLFVYRCAYAIFTQVV